MKSYFFNGKCSRCGECCTSLIPMTRKEEKIIRNYIQEHDIKPVWFQKGNFVNLQCCFYDREAKKCLIYEVRPNICKSFRCNKDIKKIELEKMENHQRSYWNHIEDNENSISNLTDMRLLFYNDPRSLINNLIYAINGTKKSKKAKVKFIKHLLEISGQKELAKKIKIEGDYYQ